MQHQYPNEDRSMDQALIANPSLSLAFHTAAPKPRKRRANNVDANKRDDLNNQMANALTADSLLSCMVCGKNFVSFGRLKSHEKTHSKTRPFKCIDCGKTFTVRYSLICHTRVHTRERPYHCTICGSRFSQASSLKTHQIYKHTKEFPYLCKFCGRGFISPGQKHEHINRTHLKTNSSGNSFANKKSRQKTTSNTTSAGIADANGQTVTNGPIMTTAAVQTHLSLPPGPLY